jgi:hypothetical protein
MKIGSTGCPPFGKTAYACTSSASVTGYEPSATPRPAGARIVVDDRSVVQDRRRRVALGESRGVDQRLECRAGLARGLDRAVELTLLEVVAAHHREHVARRDLERDQRPLSGWFLVEDQYGVGCIECHDLGVAVVFGLDRRQSEGGDVADLERGRDLTDLPRVARRLEGSRPLDGIVFDRALEPGREPDPRSVRLLVDREHDADQRLVDRERLSCGEAVLLGDARDLGRELGGADVTDRSAVALPMVEGLEPRSDGLDRAALQSEVHRRLDDETALEYALAPEPFEERAAHFFGEVGGDGVVLVLRRTGEGRRTFGRLAVARFVDEGLVPHPAEDVLAPFLGALRIEVRRVPAGGLRETREHRGLADGDLADLLPVVGAGGFADSVGPTAEIDLVQIEEENLVLGEVLLDAPSENHLADLALDVALRSEQQCLDHLLGDGAGALSNLAAGAHVRPDRSEDGDVVDALVLVERVVLGCEKGLNHVLRDLVEIPEAPPVFVELPDGLAGSIEDEARQHRLVVVQAAQIGQVRDELHVERDGERRPRGREEGDQRKQGPENQ